ncbi:4 TM domain-containing transmembrane protein [Acrasis kona]|uniref:4 TM domain-containing transmembrane protein n=1 Tax=Acrasis kona TaxID=1008807 RepID=A0AAW2ZEV6_9EUKA
MVRTSRLMSMYALSLHQAKLTKEQDMRANKSIRTRVKLLSLLVTKRFSAILWCSLTSLHISVWLLSTGIYSAAGPQFLYTTNSCSVDMYLLLVPIIGIILYFMFQLMFIVIVFAARMRDTYGIVLELFLVITGYFIASIVVLITNVLPSYSNHTEYIFVSLWFAEFAIIWDSFVMAFIPSVLSIMPSKELTKDEDLGTFLTNEKQRNSLKEYAVRSLCPEDLLCWEEIQTFKKCTNDHERAVILEKIFDLFLKPNSPMQLNLQESTISLSHIENALGGFFQLQDSPIQLQPKEIDDSPCDSPKPIMSTTMLDDLESNVVLNMIDVYKRYKDSRRR